jgi:hypothetical protein
MPKKAKSPKPEKALTYDEGKPAFAHLPWGAMEELVAVQAYGHKKYGDFYNYKKGMEVTRQVSCAIRHLVAFLRREDLDPESKRMHLAHALCRIAFLIENIKDGKAIDDRFKWPDNNLKLLMALLEPEKKR